ncbi:MAG: carboxypeptidase-like regulatory domain-containing protein [Paludibacteraceae bacterium]|nr:carboxypeptidase-like regulatory domain-containing protein [Paludibacteraceae bacterium]
MGKILKIVNFLLLCSCSVFVYARSARVYGYVVDQDNVGIELVNVAMLNTDKPIGTVTNKNGFYELMLEESDTVVLSYSMVGYTTVQQRIFDLRDVLNINVQLLTDEQWLNEVEVRGIKHTQGTMDYIDAATTRIMPDATGGSIESLLITFAGVSQTNELSSQYNVRGGAFDENSVYVNGIEVHRPLLIRSGQHKDCHSSTLRWWRMYTSRQAGSTRSMAIRCRPFWISRINSRSCLRPRFRPVCSAHKCMSDTATALILRCTACDTRPANTCLADWLRPETINLLSSTTRLISRGKWAARTKRNGQKALGTWPSWRTSARTIIVLHRTRSRSPSADRMPRTYPSIMKARRKTVSSRLLVR